MSLILLAVVFLSFGFFILIILKWKETIHKTDTILYSNLYNSIYGLERYDYLITVSGIFRVVEWNDEKTLITLESLQKNVLRVNTYSINYLIDCLYSITKVDSDNYWSMDNLYQTGFFIPDLNISLLLEESFHRNTNN